MYIIHAYMYMYMYMILTYGREHNGTSFVRSCLLNLTGLLWGMSLLAPSIHRCSPATSAGQSGAARSPLPGKVGAIAGTLTPPCVAGGQPHVRPHGPGCASAQRQAATQSHLAHRYRGGRVASMLVCRS